MARPRAGATLYRNGRCKKHGNKCWRGTFYDHAGVRREVTASLHGLSKTEARAVLERMSAEATLDQAGVTTRAARITVREYYDREYRPHLERSSEHKDSTVLKRMEHLETHWLPALGGVPLGSLDNAVVAAARAKLRIRKKDHPRFGEPPSASTLYALDKALSALVHHAALMGYFGPAAAAEETARRWRKPWRSPKAPPKRGRHAVRSLDDMGALLEAALEVGGADTAIMVLVAIATGARRGELQHMLRSSVTIISPTEAEIAVAAEMTKTGKPYVGVFVGAPGAALVQHVRRLEAELPDSPWLFPIRTKTRWRTKEGRRTVWHEAMPGDQRRTYALSDDRWRRIKARAGLPASLRIHDLKGSFVKHLARSGFSLEEQRRAARHSRLETLEHYTQDIATDADRRVGEAFAQLPLPLALINPDEAAE